MKKIISGILALLLVCGASAWAAGSLFDMTAEQAGQQLRVTVTLSEEITAQNATMLQGELYYDPEVLTPVSITASDGYGFLRCVISSREPRVQFSSVSEDSLPLTLPAGVVVTAVFDARAEESDLRLEMDLQTAEGSVVADLTEYASVRVEPVLENPFTDVPEGAFYYDPVLWAVEKGITTGATATTFNPGGDLLRTQVVVMLWRAAGMPEPESSENPFTDVKPADFYYKAVLWAVQSGITNGTSATTFGPTGVTNRAQVVTFLWRYLGQPEYGTENPFADVDAGSWYGAPVLWAVENGVTNGMSAAQFGVNANCNRAHMVTFLYRALN